MLVRATQSLAACWLLNAALLGVPHLPAGTIPPTYMWLIQIVGLVITLCILFLPIPTAFLITYNVYFRPPMTIWLIPMSIGVAATVVGHAMLFAQSFLVNFAVYNVSALLLSYGIWFYCDKYLDKHAAFYEAWNQNKEVSSKTSSSSDSSSSTSTKKKKKK